MHDQHKNIQVAVVCVVGGCMALMNWQTPVWKPYRNAGAGNLRHFFTVRPCGGIGNSIAPALQQHMNHDALSPSLVMGIDDAGEWPWPCRMFWASRMLPAFGRGSVLVISGCIMSTILDGRCHTHPLPAGKWAGIIQMGGFPAPRQALHLLHPTEPDCPVRSPIKNVARRQDVLATGA